MYLALGIAIVQSLAVSLNLPIVSGVNASLAIFMNTILLIAGTFFLVWLSDLNSLFGIGGSIVILMASMMANLPYWLKCLTSSDSVQFSIPLCFMGCAEG